MSSPCTKRAFPQPWRLWHKPDHRAGALIARYAQEAVICYDSDGAGQKATARAIPMLREAGLLVRVLTVTGGKDPDEFIRSHGDQGPARFKQLLEASGNDVEYRLQKPQTAWIYPSLMGKSHI